MSSEEAGPGLPSMQLQQMQLQHQQLQQQQMQLGVFWNQQVASISNIDADKFDFKTHQLPLARIKKIMKTDEDVRMISGEAPILFAKACELFILEITLRSWAHTEENKRRTLQRNDIAMAITKSDMFDFLIDIVPRDDIKPSKKGVDAQAAMYQQQLQQQHTAMMAQYMQSTQNGNPQAWQQHLQAAMVAQQQGDADEQEETEADTTERSTVDV